MGKYFWFILMLNNCFLKLPQTYEILQATILPGIDPLALENNPVPFKNPVRRTLWALGQYSRAMGGSKGGAMAPPHRPDKNGKNGQICSI